MFPSGAPGVALLILRLSIAGALIYGSAFCAKAGTPAFLLAVLWILGLLLCAGFLTPIVSIIACAFEITTLVVGQPPDLPFTVFLGLNTIVVALLGPGAYSADARLFGRRELTFEPQNRPDD